MSSEVVFSTVIFKNGTVEIKYEQEGTLKVYKLKPRNPVVILLPLFSTLGLAIGSDILLKQQVKLLVNQMEAKTKQ